MSLKKFIQINKKVCTIIERYLPQTEQNIFGLYEQIVIQYMKELKDSSVIIDAGDGKRCPFAKFKPGKSKIIAVDISEEELCKNNDVDDKRVADITEHLPFRNDEVDMVVSKCVVEHLGDVKNFFVESNRVLKRNGWFIHLLPSKYAPFAIIYQLLPHKVAQKILIFIHPETRGISDFQAYYDKCYYSAFKSLLMESGFKIEHVYVSYYQSKYFSFFVPLFLLSSFYELLLYYIKPKDLAAYLLIVAKKVDNIIC